MSSITLFTREGDAFRQATGEEILIAARHHVAARMRRGATLSSPKAVKEYLTIRFGTRNYETFSIIHLDLCGAAAYVKAPRLSAEIA